MKGKKEKKNEQVTGYDILDSCFYYSEQKEMFEVTTTDLL